MRYVVFTGRKNQPSPRDAVVKFSGDTEAHARQFVAEEVGEKLWWEIIKCDGIDWDVVDKRETFGRESGGNDGQEVGC